MTKIEELRKVFASRLLTAPITTTPHVLLTLDEDNKNYMFIRRATPNSARSSCGNVRMQQHSVQLMEFLKRTGKKLNDPSISVRMDIGVTFEDLLPYLTGYGRFATYRSSKVKGSPASIESTMTIFQLTHKSTQLRYYLGRNDRIKERTMSRIIGPMKQNILGRIKTADLSLHAVAYEILKGQGVDAWDIKIYDKDVPAEDSLCTVSELNGEANCHNLAILQLFHT